MSTYEKLAVIVICILVIGMVFFSYHEYKEPAPEPTGTMNVSQFSSSRGKNFIIGPYTTISSQTSSAVSEDNCEPWKPVIIATLHDIKEHLEHNFSEYPSFKEYAFEVSEPALDLFCRTTAEITLSAASGNKLLLQKIPFVRTIPPQGAANDVGREVRINATLIPKGSSLPSQPTTYGDVLIPDRYLDTITPL